MTLPPEQIVCATDFSPAAAAAARRAADLAAQHGAQLTLLHVVPTSLWDDVTGAIPALAQMAAPDVGQLGEQAAARLRREAYAVEVDFGRSCGIEVRHGRPAATIAAAARELGADLLVVGAHGAHPARALMGTTAQKLLRTAPCPLLVVRRGPPPGYRTVLLPTDFSPAAAHAAAAARALVPDAAYHFVHAFELPYDGLLRYSGVEAATAAHYRTVAEQALAARLAALAAEFAPVPGRASAHVRHGYAPTRIDEWIAELGADLVAIAPHGKSPLETTFVGSVSLHVLQAAPCDVLLVRDTGLT